MSKLVCPRDNWRNAIEINIDQAAILQIVADSLGLLFKHDKEHDKIYLDHKRPTDGKTAAAIKKEDKPGMYTTHFHRDEFRDGDGNLEFEDNLKKVAAKLEDLRRYLGGRPIEITSGYRSASYNARIGGVPNSQHLLGRAADIVVEGVSVDKIAEAAIHVGFRGVGRYYTQGFVHCDIRPGSPGEFQWEG